MTWGHTRAGNQQPARLAYGLVAPSPLQVLRSSKLHPALFPPHTPSSPRCSPFTQALRTGNEDEWQQRLRCHYHPQQHHEVLTECQEWVSTFKSPHAFGGLRGDKSYLALPRLPFLALPAMTFVPLLLLLPGPLGRPLLGYSWNFQGNMQIVFSALSLLACKWLCPQKEYYWIY